MEASWLARSDQRLHRLGQQRHAHGGGQLRPQDGGGPALPRHSVRPAVGCQPACCGCARVSRPGWMRWKPGRPSEEQDPCSSSFLGQEVGVCRPHCIQRRHDKLLLKMEALRNPTTATCGIRGSCTSAPDLDVTQAMAFEALKADVPAGAGAPAARAGQVGRQGTERPAAGRPHRLRPEHAGKTKCQERRDGGPRHQGADGGTTGTLWSRQTWATSSPYWKGSCPRKPCPGHRR